MTEIITSLLGFTIVVLKVLLVIGLVIGSVVAAKKYLFGDEKIDFSFNKIKAETITPECPHCKAALQADYKFCPNCGATKEAVAEQKAVVETA
ncbi:MAG: zinc ribbon domain-containing protein [Clostridia bacterium]|nr:zinc ribbon domain-containing protein [Clostridia bacterium]